MSRLAKAIEISFSAHKGQKDKSEAEHLLYSLHVMKLGKTEVEKN